MNNILVIGGSGFIGSHTSDLLSDNGYSVSILDKFISPWLQDNQKMIVGDVEFNEETLNKVSAITPVPGGVGPMTITMLMSNLEEGWRRQNFDKDPRNDGYD